MKKIIKEKIRENILLEYSVSPFNLSSSTNREIKYGFNVNGINFTVYFTREMDNDWDVSFLDDEQDITKTIKSLGNDINFLNNVLYTVIEICDDAVKRFKIENLSFFGVYETGKDDNNRLKSSIRTNLFKRVFYQKYPNHKDAISTEFNTTTIDVTKIYPELFREKNITETNKIIGGKADKLSVNDIAKKFKVPTSKIKNQITKGIKVELEHTNDKQKALEIVMDHLTEFPDYYDRLIKMEKQANKEINENTKSLIKRLIRENLNTDIFTEEYFKQRIPFLKEYKFFNRKNGIEAQRVIFHENVKKMFGNEILLFPQFNVSSEFIYYKHQINELVFHNFILKNKFHFIQPDNMDDLEYRVFNLAMNQVNEKLSYSYETDSLDENELNKIINDLNETFFKIEKFSEDNNTSLF